jgi:hypothetical protein
MAIVSPIRKLCFIGLDPFRSSGMIEWLHRLCIHRCGNKKGIQVCVPKPFHLSLCSRPST